MKKLFSFLLLTLFVAAFSVAAAYPKQLDSAVERPPAGTYHAPLHEKKATKVAVILLADSGSEFLDNSQVYLNMIQDELKDAEIPPRYTLNATRAATNDYRRFCHANGGQAGHMPREKTMFDYIRAANLDAILFLFPHDPEDATENDPADHSGAVLTLEARLITRYHILFNEVYTAAETAKGPGNLSRKKAFSVCLGQLAPKLSEKFDR